MISKDIEKVLLTEEQIEQRCKELAAQIEHDYEQENTVPIIVFVPGIGCDRTHFSIQPTAFMLQLAR